MIKTLIVLILSTNTLFCQFDFSKVSKVKTPIREASLLSKDVELLLDSIIDSKTLGDLDDGDLYLLSIEPLAVKRYMNEILLSKEEYVLTLFKAKFLTDVVKTSGFLGYFKHDGFPILIVSDICSEDLVKNKFDSKVFEFYDLENYCIENALKEEECLTIMSEFSNASNEIVFWRLNGQFVFKYCINGQG